MNVERLREAIAAFDRANAEDPHQVDDHGVLRPRELVAAERLSAWVEAIEPEASEALRLAARCQHIRRWQSPRDSFPAGRVGYLQWRTQLARFHAETATRILETLGYEPAEIETVRGLNLKHDLRHNPDTQTLEDALCLAFLEFELGDFASHHPAEQVSEILQKTWKKMSPRGQECARSLPFDEPLRSLVQHALGT